MSDWIISIIGDFGYAGIFLLMVLESLFPPIPSELIIPFAGFSAAKGTINPFGVIAAATAGAVTGMIPWYLVGRLFGLERTRRLADRFGRWLTVNAGEIEYAERVFRRRGPIIVLAGRLLPIIRTLISIPAGIAKMPAPLFLAASATGALIWNTILVGAGYILNEHYELVEGYLDPLTILVIAAVVLLYVFRLVTWRPSRAR